MSRPASAPSTSTPWARTRITGLCVAFFLLAASSAWAARLVRVYEVDADGQSTKALQDAMRQVLVRATGRRESADDPAFASLVAEAPKYVKGYTTGPRGESQVVFDGAAVEQAINTVGRSVWDPQRPFTLIVLVPPRVRTGEDTARAELERVAAERGLPITLIPLALTDAAGNPLSADALLQAAQRYGGDEILIGRGDTPTPDAPLQWTLYTHALSESWNGPLAAGIDRTVDLLVPQQQGASLAQAEAAARIEIDGVTSLNDYAAIGRLLQSAPGVRRANLAGADPGNVVFDVLVRGGAAGLDQVLAGSPNLQHISSSGTWVIYRYQP